ncbi:hypothetical protein M413DRAFT_32793 [Hebeloma cylindrosporum]|uniref:Uncharacterized protein n=1 Tax=Hebeloma cylindrosporum TaxID=76867 RepID=A0A0C3BSP6_HEBCY|nr:hypothetical protein M413DRAFT_32793 [Hebeloma cylindrosporum h7]
MANFLISFISAPESVMYLTATVFNVNGNNIPGANRVHQLCQDIVQIQTQLTQAVADAHVADEAAFELRNVIAQNAGFMTLDGYFAAAGNQLTAAERATFENLGLEGPVEGAPHTALALQQRYDLKAAIVELCKRRFRVKRLQEQARTILNLNVDWFVGDDLNAIINGITSQNIWNLLDAQDNDSNSWKNEDPTLDVILQ